MSEVKNSHIQITRGLLKRFSFDTKSDGKKVNYLDLQTNEIREEKIRILGTKEKYYNSINEVFLCNIETRFGKIAKKIKDFQNCKFNSIDISEEDATVIKDFFEYSLIRSEKHLEQVNKNSIISQIFHKLSHDDILEISKDRETDRKVDIIFDDFKTNVIINKTNINFVIPRNVFYVIIKDKNQREWYIMPIDPKIAIVMIHKDNYNEYIDKSILSYLKIEEDNSIFNLNEYALTYEKSQNNQFIVGDKQELTRLQQYNKVKEKRERK